MVNSAGLHRANQDLFGRGRPPTNAGSENPIDRRLDVSTLGDPCELGDGVIPTLYDHFFSRFNLRQKLGKTRFSFPNFDRDRHVDARP